MSPRQPPAQLPPVETFRFTVENWRLEYGLHLWDAKPMPEMERGSEMISLVVSGPPIGSKTKRRIKRIELSLIPADYDPNKPLAHWKGIGTSERALRGVLRAQVHLPPVTFQTFAVCLAADKVRTLEFDLHRAPQGHSLVKNFSIDPSSEVGV